MALPKPFAAGPPNEEAMIERDRCLIQLDPMSHGRWRGTDEQLGRLHLARACWESGWDSAIIASEKRISDLEASVKTLRGCIVAADERLYAAGASVGVEFEGCHTPDVMAEIINDLRSRLDGCRCLTK